MRLPTLRFSSWAILAAAGLLHLGLLIGWRWQLPLVPYFFDATVLSGGRGLDFYSIYQAGYNARHGLDIYEGDPARAPVVVPYSTPFRYLPIVAYTAGAALSLLAPLTAYKVWVVLIELALLACVATTFALTRRTPDRFAPLALMWLVFTPYYLELFMGQFSFIQAALVWGMMVIALIPGGEGLWPLVHHGAHTPTPLRGGGQAGTPRQVGFDALWITSVLWKITTVLFIPVLIRLRRWRALVLAGSLGLVLTLPYFFVFPAHLADFVRNNAGGQVAGHELGNLGLRQFVYQALTAVEAPQVIQPIAQTSIVILVLAAALWTTFRAPRLHLIANLALWLTVFFLISPQVWEHHYVMLLPALVGLYLVQPSRLFLAIWLLLALPTPFGFIGLQPIIAANHDLRAFALEPAWQPLLQHASKALPTLVLFLYTARLHWSWLEASYPHGSSEVAPGI